MAKFRDAEVVSRDFLVRGTRGWLVNREMAEKLLKETTARTAAAIAVHEEAMLGSTAQCHVANLIRIGDVQHCHDEKLVDAVWREIRRSWPQGTWTPKRAAEVREQVAETMSRRSPHGRLAKAMWTKAAEIAVEAKVGDPFGPLARDRLREGPPCVLSD